MVDYDKATDKIAEEGKFADEFASDIAEEMIELRETDFTKLNDKTVFLIGRRFAENTSMLLELRDTVPNVQVSDIQSQVERIERIENAIERRDRQGVIDAIEGFVTGLE